MDATRPAWVRLTTALALVVVGTIGVALVITVIIAEVSLALKIAGILATAAITAGAGIRIVIASRPYGDPKR